MATERLEKAALGGDLVWLMGDCPFRKHREVGSIVKLEAVKC